jgi:hypothetical protein
MVTTRDQANPLPVPIIDDLEDSDLSARDTGILRAIQEEGLTVFSFDGLKRLLGVHQEMLSRVLARLEEVGLLEKVADGYRLTVKTGELLPRQLSSSEPRVPIVQSLLPQDISMEPIISGLKGRWFGSLRWLGYSQSDEGTVLKWITEEDGIQIDAKFTDTYLSIDAKVPDGREVSRAVKASHQLLGYISRLYGGPQRVRRIASPVVFYPGLDFA